jgi:hypothetical protein
LTDEPLHPLGEAVSVSEGDHVERDEQVPAAAALVELVRPVHGGTEFAAGEHTGEHIHHQRDRVAFVPSHGQDHPADGRRRVGGGHAVLIDGQPGGIGSPGCLAR